MRAARWPRASSSLNTALYISRRMGCSTAGTRNCPVWYFSLVDEKGQPQNGFLRAHEVYNLKLGAELVVLSGCQTALGKEVQGEGLLSLTRGFMYAGAPRVVASLWRVPDKATAELMKRFYRGVLVEGLTPAAALRTAQMALWKESRLSAPYYWAAFVLQGEWK